MLEIKRLKINVKESMSGINAYKAFSVDNFRINKTKGVYYVKGKKEYIDAFYDSLIGSSKFSFRRLFKKKNSEAVNLLLIDGKKNKLGKYLIEDTKSNREFFARQTVETRLNYGKRVFDESKMILEEIGINYYSKIKELTNYQFLRLELLNASLKKPAVLLVNPTFLTDLSEEEIKEIDSRIKKIGSDILVFYPSNDIIDEDSNQIIINENSFLLKQDDRVEYYSKKDEEKSSVEPAVLTRDKRLFKKKFILNFPKIAFTCSTLIFTLSTVVLNLLINDNFALVINNPYQYSSIIFGGNLDYLSKLVEQKNVSFNSEIAEIMASDKQVNLPAKLETSAIKPRYSFDFNNFNYLTLPAAQMNESYKSTTYHDVFNPEENVYYDESTSSYFYFDRNVSQTDIDKVIDDLNIYPAAVIRNLPLAEFNSDTGNPDKFTFLDNFDLSNYLINGIKYDENSIKESLSAYYPISSNYFVFVNGTDNATKHFPSYLTMLSGSVPKDSYGMVITDYKLELYKKFGFQYYENGELKTIPGDQVTAENILNKQIYLNDITTNSYGNYHTYWDKDYWNKFTSGKLGYDPDKELLNELISTSNLVELSKVYISGVCKFENENNDVEHFIDYANDQLEGIVSLDSSSSAVSTQSISPLDLYGLARKRLSQNNEIWGSYYDSIYANFALNTMASPASAVYVNANSTFNKLYCGTAFSSEKTLYDFFKLGDTYDNLLSFFLCDRYKDNSEYLNLLSMSRFSHVYKSEDLLKNYKLCFYPIDVFDNYIFYSIYHHTYSSYYKINKYISNNIELNTLLFDSKTDVLYPILNNDFKTENKDYLRTFVSEPYFNDLDLSEFETYSVQYSFNNRQDLNWLKTALVALNCLIVVVLICVYKPYKQSYQTVLKNNKYGIIKQGCSIALMLLVPILLAFGTSLLISFAQLGDYSFVLGAALPNYEGMYPIYQIGNASSLPIFTYNSVIFADILSGFGYSLPYIFLIPFGLYIGVCLIARYLGKYIFQAYSKVKESVSHFFKKIVDNYLKD